MHTDLGKGQKEHQYHLVIEGETIDWKRPASPVSEPFENRYTSASLRTLIQRLESLEGVFFNKDLVHREQLPLYIASCGIADAKGEVLAMQRFLPGTDANRVPAGLYLELSSSRMPGEVYQVFSQADLPSCTAKGPLLDYFLRQTEKQLAVSIQQLRRKVPAYPSLPGTDTLQGNAHRQR